MGLTYPVSVKIVRVNCLTRVHMGHILNAFDFGAEGVMLLGCEPGECHFCSDDDYIVNEYKKTQGILEMMGIWKDRVTLVRLPAFNGQRFVDEIMNLTREIEQIPSSRCSKIIGARPVYDGST
jgi:coenzyme F420-reducing hydrogenase delta subunit